MCKCSNLTLKLYLKSFFYFNLVVWSWRFWYLNACDLENMLDLLSFFSLTDKCLDTQKGLYQIQFSEEGYQSVEDTERDTSAENVGQQKRKKRRIQYKYRICTTGKLILWAPTECRNCFDCIFCNSFLSFAHLFNRYIGWKDAADRWGFCVCS